MLSAFKNFLVTFLVAALIFGIVGYFTAGYVSGIVSGILDGEKDQLENIINNTPENTTAEVTIPEEPDPDLKVPEGESFTFVVVGTDYRPDIYKNYYHTSEETASLIESFSKKESSIGILKTKKRMINATWIVLVRADKENREFVSCYISPETRVGAPYGDATLGEVYGMYGMASLCEYIEAMTRLSIDYTFIIDGINGSDFISSMGSVNFDLGIDIYSSGEYHLSASTSVVTVDTDADNSSDTDTEDAESIEGKKDNSDKEKPDDKADVVNGDPEENTENTKTVDNVLVLKKGEQSISDYSVHILNTFKEMSNGDVNIKSDFILDMLESYLRRCADWSEQELAAKINELSREKDYFLKDDTDTNTDTLPNVNGSFDDPYSSKSVLATNLTAETVSEIYSMLEAIEYFDYTEYLFPGSYSEESHMYIPDTTAALEFFAKYNNK